jgi:RND family efflux transporter MFP subunit
MSCNLQCFIRQSGPKAPAVRLLTAAAVLLAVAGCQPPAAPSSQAGGASAASAGEAPAPRVSTVRPVRKTLVRRTEQPGQIAAFEETPLFAKVTGYVKRVNVDIGDHVAGPKYDEQGRLTVAGQVLAELSIPELEEELRQKQAQIVQAEAEVKQAAAAVKVSQAEAASAQAQVAEAQAATERSEAEYARWKSELNRMTELADKGAVTRKLVDETENNFRAADSARSATAAKIKSAQALQRVSAAQIEKTEADLAASEAKLLVARADEQRVQALNGYAVIRAPFDGIVTTRNVDTGHLVQTGVGSAGKPLFVVVRTDIVRIFVDVPESDAVLIEPQDEALVRVPSLSPEPVRGTVTRTAWILNTGTRTLRTEIDVPNPDGKLRPGMYAHADLKVAERPDVLTLPKAAILTHENRAYCWSVDPTGKVVRVPLTLGIQSGNEVEVVSGLTGSEDVIALNAAAFREGQQVEIARPEAGKTG